VYRPTQNDLTFDFQIQHKYNIDNGAERQKWKTIEYLMDGKLENEFSTTRFALSTATYSIAYSESVVYEARSELGNALLLV